MKDLLEELWWLTDDEEPMREFCKALTEWGKWIKIYSKAKVVDPYDFGFIGDIYIIHNLREETEIEYASKTVEFIIECYEEDDDKEYWKNFWIPKIQKIVKQYYDKR